MIINLWQIKVVAEDQETAEYAQHRLPDIIPVYNLILTFHPIDIIINFVLTHIPGAMGSVCN